jgi:integrase
VPLIPELLAALRAAARMPGRGAARRRPACERSGYVVIDPLGRRYHPDTVSDYGAAACAKAGVKRIRLHDARHTCGTLMHLEHNVPVGWPPIGHGTRWNRCEQAGRGEIAWTAERR